MSSITSIIDAPARRSIAQTCDDLAILLLAAIAIVASLTFKSYGLGWDDYTHAEYAELLLNLYKSGFTDKSALSFVNLYMYGGGFDMAAALLHKVLPLELFETRRLVGAFVGVIGIALTWRLGRRVGGPIAGLAALILVTVCPAFYGHVFMNPKDIPFAIAMVVLMLGLVRLVEEYPAPTPQTVLIVGLGAGLALGCRILGGFALIYALIGFVPLFIEDLRAQGLREAIHRIVRTVYVLIPGLIFGYLVMGLIWPWSIVELDNPLRAMTYFSAFFEKPWKELFNGALVSVPDMPWSYLPTLFALKLPEAMMVPLVIGLAVAIGSQARRDIPARRKMILIMIALAAMLPLMVAMVKRPALYNGIRHFLFVVPPTPAMTGTAGGRWRGVRFRRRNYAAADGNDPSAPLPVYVLQPHRRHGTRRRRALHARLLGSRLEAGVRGTARATGRAPGGPTCEPQVEGRGLRSAEAGAGRTWTRVLDRLGQPERRLRDDTRRVLLQGPQCARAGGDQARRRCVRPRLRHSRQQHLQPADDSGAVITLRLPEPHRHSR
jgi:hypothetical protein